MGIYSDDELQAPKWLSKDFFQSILKSAENVIDLEIIDLAITPATMKGDHFASCMFRAKIDYRKGSGAETETRSLIVKTMPDLDTPKGKMLGDMKLFDTEIAMYTKTLPKVEEILAKHGDNTRLGPKVVYASLEPTKVIVFEDLCEMGYSPVRGRFLQVEELKDVMAKIAKLHAVTYMLGKSEHSELVTGYKDGIFSHIEVFQVPMMTAGMKQFQDLLETHDEFRVYLPQFLEIEKEAKEYCIALYNAYQNGDTEDIFVLNHGDFHIKNLMLKENAEQQSEDVMLVDYQLSVYGPPMIDLFYATFMMFDAESRCEKRNEILRYYFEQFTATLKRINFNGKIPKYAELQMCGLKYRVFAKYMMASFLPSFLKMATVLPADLKDINEEEFYKAKSYNNIYSNPQLLAELRKLLPYMLNGGYLD